MTNIRARFYLTLILGKCLPPHSHSIVPGGFEVTS